MVLCIMHIYAHILAVEDDEAGRRGFGKLRAPYLCKCLRIRVAPCATFFTDLSLSKLTSLESAPNFPRILYVIGEKKKEPQREKKEGRIKSRKKRGNHETRIDGNIAWKNEKSRCQICLGFSFSRAVLTRGAEKPEPEKGKGSAERRRENATVKPPPGRTITISRRATRSLYQEERFTSNLFLSFRGNRSPMTFCPSFPPFRSSMLVRPYAFHEACTEILPPTKPFGSRCTSSVCFVRVVAGANPLCASRFSSTNRRRAVATSTPRRRVSSTNRLVAADTVRGWRGATTSKMAAKSREH